MSKNFNLTSKTGRDRLKPRREPYWHRIEKGLYLGYRMPVQGEGTWIVRKQDENGKKKYQALGTFSDAKDAISSKKAFDRAKDEAQKLANQMDMGIDSRGLTVSDVCHSYVQELKTRKGLNSAADADGRFKRLVYDAKIGKILLSKLTATNIRSWFNAQVVTTDEEDTRKSKDSANRNLSALKAALNLARVGQLVMSDAAWSSVKPFKDVGMRRVGFLTMEERGKLIDSSPPDLGNFIRALLLTAARPGELSSACVQDFDKGQGTLALSGKTGHRVVTLSTAGMHFFSQITQGRIGKSPLLPREDGSHWNKDSWKKLFRVAVKAAKLPDATVLYTLRHIAITELVNSGMDTFSVAQLAGTSTTMIDKHYGHLRHDKTRRKLDAVRMV